MYYETFSRNVNEVIELAAAVAKRLGCRYIGREHVLFGLMYAEDGRAAAILRGANVDRERYFLYLQKAVDPQLIISGSMFTAPTKKLFETSVEISLKARAWFSVFSCSSRNL